jgi:pilus assembly protein CpaC
MRSARLFIFVIAVLGPGVLYAQSRPLPASAVIAAAGESDTSSVHLYVGRSTLIDVGTPIARVSLTSADVADALVTTHTQLLVHGKMPGTISMFVWDRAGAIRRYEINVTRDTARASEQLKQLFPDEKIDVSSSGKGIVLAGSVSSKEVIDRVVEVANGYVEKKDEVVNLLQLQAGAQSNQVMLKVRFAEVSRSALTQLGINLFTGANGYKNWIGRSTTQQFPAPAFKDGSLVFSDFLNIFLFNTEHQLGATIQAMQNKGLFQSLAEPNLVAESGKEASFLAGGEIPVPIAQPSGGAVTVTIQWKEFGVRLNFTPVINGDRVHLKVRPEVSTLDFTNAITLQGFRIPALSTRRAETELELMDGQTFAMAGLMDNLMNKSLQKIPGIGDIPILGLLFKSVENKKDQTELVVMITPQILARNSTGVATTIPRLVEPYMTPLPPKQTIEPPPPAFPQAGKPGPAGAKAQPLPSNAASRVANEKAPIESGPLTASAPLSKKDQEAMIRAQKQELEKKQAEARAQAAAQAAHGQEAAKQAEIDRRKAEEDKQQQEKLAREKAKRDAEAAQRQAEIDKKQQKAVAEAAAKLKAAQDAYQAEVAKQKKNPQN